MKKILIVSAMKEELDICREKLSNRNDIDYLLTGIGMVEAGVSLAQVLEHNNPYRIINIGVVGAVNPTLSVGDVIVGKQVRNIDAFVPFKGYEYHTDWIGESEWRLGTSNAFATDKTKLPKDIDIIDMEGFALAKVAKDYSIPFLYIKGVSDGRNDTGLEFMDCIELAMKNACEKLISIL